MYSSVGGQLIEEASRIGGLLTQQITGPIVAAHCGSVRQGGVDTFVEMGQGEA
ncbi:MAG: hypothetical protein R3C68_09440 [Myxococcota bacterium]